MLVSPGLEITVTDESQYAPTAVGSVPLVVIATAENKTVGGAIAPGTKKEIAGQLQAVTSQRDLINTFGQPLFYRTSTGTPINGHELNEYGLMAAYSALGLSNRSYILRADIDTSQIVGSPNRPISDPANGTMWLDLVETKWGIYEWNASTQEFIHRKPLLIDNEDETITILTIDYPVESVGQVGDYAIVLTNSNNRLFYKRHDNVWTLVGSKEWQLSHQTITGSALNPVFSAGDQITINTINVVVGSSVTPTPTPGDPISLAQFANDINAASIPGVFAATLFNHLVIYANDDAMSNGITADGKVIVANVIGTPLTTAGVTGTTFMVPTYEISPYTNIPDWRSFDATPRPSGSVWIKSSSVGGGANLVFKKYNAESDTWSTLATPIFTSEAAALYGMDPAAGGNGIQAGSLYIKTAFHDGSIKYVPYVRKTQGLTSVTGESLPVSAHLVPGNSFSVTYSKIGTDTLETQTIVITNSMPNSIVTAILAMNAPEVTASWNPTTRQVTITHVFGGVIYLRNIAGTPLQDAGINTSNPSVDYDPDTLSIVVSNFSEFEYAYSITKPYTGPVNGTLWYYNTPFEVDIMINDIGGWKGYRNVSSDARGYNLVNTDPAGPILSPVEPETQSDGTPLVAGDLWIDTGDLENYPRIYRRTSSNRWVEIDNTDRFTQNGIVFADARWDTDGTRDVVADPKARIVDLLTSNYTDLDCPDYRLYPRGTLLFNMRRSGFNVKRYVQNYFNEDDYPDVTLPAVKDTWITASGLMNNGAMYAGRKAQRAMIVSAMKKAVDTNEAIREDVYQYNLIACPGYPELIPNLVALNNDKKNVAFVIGDTPMNLPTNIVSITNWVENRFGDGLSTPDPYLGIYYPSGLTNDLSGNTIVVPPSHVMLRTMIRNDNVSYPWFAPAGMRRGLIDNVYDIGYVDQRTGSFVRNGINQGMRDALYSMNINPLTALPRIGLVVFGQKTRNPFASSLDRVNVARLVNYIRTVLARVSDGFLFEPNDAQTRREFKAVVDSVFSDLVAKRGIYDYLVVCDESNNTPDRIARNELYCDVFIEPVRAIEFVMIPIRLKNPGAIKAGV